MMSNPRRWYHRLILLTALLWPLAGAILATSVASYNAPVRLGVIASGVVVSTVWFKYMDRSGKTVRLIRWLGLGSE